MRDLLFAEPLLMNRAEEGNMLRWYNPGSTFDSVCPGIAGVFHEAATTRPSNVAVPCALLEPRKRQANVSQPDRKRMKATIHGPDNAANIEFQEARVKSLKQEAWEALQILVTKMNGLNDARNRLNDMKHAQA